MLQQEINLYRFFKPSQTLAVFLTWKQLWLANLAVIGLFILVYLFSLLDIAHLESKKIDMDNQVKALQENFFQVKNSYPPLFFSSDVNQSISHLQDDLATEERVLSTITNRIPFSNELVAFAEAIIPDVWLTSIDISTNGKAITMKGQSMSMENLHKFLENLLHENIFSGFSLNVNNIENLDKNNKNGNLNFEISLVKTP